MLVHPWVFQKVHKLTIAARGKVVPLCIGTPYKRRGQKKRKKKLNVISGPREGLLSS